jgi:hypothetical protein
MDQQNEERNISSIDVDMAVRPGLAHLKAYFETPSDRAAKTARDVLKGIAEGGKRYSGENTRAALAMKAGRELGTITEEELRASIGPVLKR